MRTSISYLAAMVAIVLPACGSDISSNEEVFVTVVVRADGDGSGSVTVETPDLPVFPWDCTIVDGSTSGDGLNVGQCSRTYTLRDGDLTDVEFTAAGSGGRFLEWSGSSCSGTNPVCRVPDIGGDFETLSVTAHFEAAPSAVELTVDGHSEALFLLQGLAADARAVARKANGQEIAGALYTWTTSDASVASVAGTSSGTAVVRAEAPGSATITATARGVASNPVAVTVAAPGPEPGVLRGTMWDVDESTGVEGIVVRVGGATPARLTTDAEGGYEATDLTAGSYTVYAQGRRAFRFLSSEVHTVTVLSGATVVEDLPAREGSFLEILSGSHDVQSASGGTVSVTVDFRTWSRSGCPGCVPALILGVDGEPLVLHRFGTPGAYPGTQYTPSLQFTAPPQGGTIYAMLVTGISTASEEGKEAARTAYRERYSNGLYEETFIPIGTLTVN